MKRINRKDYQRLQELARLLEEEFGDLTHQSATIWRGDVHAILWAAWWISEAIAEDLKLRKVS